MDPATLSGGLVVYGPLGLWALAATMAVVWLYRDNGKLRDAHAAEVAGLNENYTTKLEALGRENTATAAQTAAAITQQVQALGTLHATAIREQAAATREQGDRYDRQVGELQQRILNVVTTVTDKLASLADAITRNRSPR